MSWEQRPIAEVQIGNGALLATFDAFGEIEQLFSPQIDALQARLGAFQTTVVVPVGLEGHAGAPELIPINATHFDIRLQLSPGSQVLSVEYYHRSRPLKMIRRLAIHPSDPIILDQWKLMDERAGLLHQSIPWVGYTTSAHCSMYHPVFNGIVHHLLFLKSAHDTFYPFAGRECLNSQKP